MATTDYLSEYDVKQTDLDLLKALIKDYTSFHAKNRQNATRSHIFQLLLPGMGDFFGTF